MLRVLHALLCGAILASSASAGQIGGAADSRAAYANAARAVQDRDFALAASLLRPLLDCDDPTISSIARARLPELLLRSGNTEEAMTEIRRQLDSSQKPGALTEDQLRHFETYLAAATQLDQARESEALRWMHAQLIRHIEAEEQKDGSLQKELHGPLTTLTDRLASRMVANGLFQDARDLIAMSIRQLPEGQTTALSHRYAYGIPLQHAKTLLAARRYIDCQSVLAGHDLSNWPANESHAALLLLLESNLRLGRYDEASKHSNTLDQLANDKSLNPKWLSTLRLRQAELLLAIRDYDACQLALDAARLEHQDFELYHEYDFLAVKLAIARIDFEKAIAILQSLAHRHAPNSEMYARCHWMWGEVLLMQRQIESAAEHYQVAAAQNAFPNWQSCALVQLARCQEAMGNRDDAIRNYQRATSVAGDPHASREAQARVAYLQTTELQTR